jgi:predicted Fe-Mo cluster-binding NifX family protein
MVSRIAIPVTGENITGPGEALEVHIYEIENQKYKLFDKYENPALKATSTKGIYMLKSVLDKHVDAIIVSEIGAPGVRFLKGKLKIYYSNNLNETEAIDYYIKNKLEELTVATHDVPHHDGNVHEM